MGRHVASPCNYGNDREFSTSLHSAASQREGRKNKLKYETYAVPCMTRTSGVVKETHRQPLTRLTRNHIKQLDFKEGVEMWGVDRQEGTDR